MLVQAIGTADVLATRGTLVDPTLNMVFPVERGIGGSKLTALVVPQLPLRRKVFSTIPAEIKGMQ